MVNKKEKNKKNNIRFSVSGYGYTIQGFVQPKDFIPVMEDTLKRLKALGKLSTLKKTTTATS